MPLIIKIDPHEMTSLLENGQKLGLYKGYEANIDQLKRNFEDYLKSSDTQARRHCFGILAYLKALIGAGEEKSKTKVNQNALAFIPCFLSLSCPCKSHGKTSKITFFEVLSYGFESTQILQVIDDFFALSTRVPPRDYSKILYNMVHIAGVALIDFDADAMGTAKIMAKRLNSLQIYVRGLPFDEWCVTPSGANTHHGNKQTVFLSMPGETSYSCVYKPHPLEADRAVGQSIRWFNARLKRAGVDSRFALPVPKLNVESGTEEWLASVPDRTKEQSEVYYTQMGELLFLTKLIGISNVHANSLIPTAEGPVIADAECAFEPWTMAGESLNATGVLDALSEGKNGGEFAAYSAQLSAGYRQALESCEKEFLAETKTFLEALDRLRGMVKEPRFLPVSAKITAELFREYAVGMAVQNRRAYGELLRVLETRYAESLDRELLLRLLHTGFGNGDMPYFTLRYAKGILPRCGVPCKLELCCNGFVFGWASIYLPHFAESLNFLETAGAEQLAHFLTCHTPKPEE